MSGLHFHALRVASVRADADDALLVTFDLPSELQDTFRFVPGQYLTLRAGDLRRSYSICAGPGEKLRIGVRRVPGGAFSGRLHTEIKAGDVVDVMEPQGRFGAGLEQSPRHVLAVAGGSGITPVIAILKAVLASQAQARCTLLYGNRSMASTMFKEELEDLKNRYLSRLALHVVFSRELVDSPLHNGRLDSAKISSFLKLAGPVDQAFVCGPHAMNDEVEAALLQAGLAPDRIHVERFGIPLQDHLVSQPPAPLPGDVPAARIGIVRDGLTREVDFHVADGNILQAAVRAGMDLPYSCRSGVCATCRAKLLQGRVRMERNFALEKDDEAAGFVLTCQARPLTDGVVVSFDHR
jgi:ring-1,2-phenylacetyl-CoA epoxidase subunit PaaE